jgi:hypothetical protein
MNRLSPQRRKVVLLCSSAACLAGVVPMLLQAHRTLAFVWLAMVFVLLGFGIAGFAKLKREEG